MVWEKNWSEVTWGQVWCPILGIWALHLTHPKCTHTAVNTHPEQWAAIFAAALGEQLGVRCLAQGQLSRGIEGGESAVHSPPPTPTYNPSRIETRTGKPLGYESDSLTIRPRLLKLKREKLWQCRKYSREHQCLMNHITSLVWTHQETPRVVDHDTKHMSEFQLECPLVWSPHWAQRSSYRPSLNVVQWEGDALIRWWPFPSNPFSSMHHMWWESK